MKKICRPYKKASLSHITQGFHDNHKAIDFAFKYRTYLVAPEECIIDKIITPTIIDESLEDLNRGYGIVLSSPVIYGHEYFYWHCLPIFPVKEGDIVKQGQIIAQMGNSGFVKSGGKIVPLEGRLKPPYKGTHLHWVMKIDNEIVNPIYHIDWNIPIPNDWLGAAKAILLNMLEFLKGR